MDTQNAIFSNTAKNLSLSRWGFGSKSWNFFENLKFKKVFFSKLSF